MCEFLNQVVVVYVKFRVIIVIYGMGIIQYNKGIFNVCLIVDLLLMCGNIGKLGVGICFLCGYLNVQGNCIVGISEKFFVVFFDSLQWVMGIMLLWYYGYDVVKVLEVMIVGEVKVLICFGGNFVVVMLDYECVFLVMCGFEFSVYVGIKFNCLYFLMVKEIFILLCLGCIEFDLQVSGWQLIIVEDLMLMVYVLLGKFKFVLLMLCLELVIVVGLVKVILFVSKVDWQYFVEDYDCICDLIEQIISGFEDYNQCICYSGGFCMLLLLIECIWFIVIGKVMFLVFKGVYENVVVEGEDVMCLVMLCSYDQYNIIIYVMDDCYCGVFGCCDVLFMNEQDMVVQGLEYGDWVDIYIVLLGSVLMLEDIMVVVYGIVLGIVGVYYLEVNVLVLLNYFDEESGIFLYKLVFVCLMLCLKEICLLVGGC